MKKFFFFLSLFLVVTLACDISVNLTPTNTVPPAAETPMLIEPPTTTPEVFISLTQAIPETPVTSTLVTFGRLTLEIPSSVASGASGKEMPPITIEDAHLLGECQPAASNQQNAPKKDLNDSLSSETSF